MSHAIVLDLDEDLLISVGDGGTETVAAPSPLGPLPPGPLVVVRSGAELDLARLELIRHAVGPREFHACGRLVAAAAAAAATGAEGTLLVCDATWATLRAGLVTVNGTRLHLGRFIEVPDLGGLAFASTVAPEAPATALAETLDEEAHRIAAVTGVAADDDLYRDVRAASVAGHDVSAGALMDAVAGYERRLRAELGPLRPADAVWTVVSGGFGGFGLLRGLFGQVSGREPVGGTGWVATGAAVLARGRYGEPAPDQVRAVLPLHRRRHGRFEQMLVGLPSAYGSFAALDGRPLLLGVCDAEPCDVPLGHRDPLRIEIDGLAREADLSDLPTGRYQIGLRTLRDGTPRLVLFDPDGSPPAVLSPSGPARNEVPND
ncbi:hypothetical protein [Actinomadura harenae]|uniref:Uncharacterized protein n=1 Tax=Actinomadura harenae TaxID=2483351 RepID=A0A3M2LM56_9ACTN|nr:hypothetical protein [Actinomadura harenae]RMI38206.1 hypothetical protein EBO15_33580 [Actinomadura harenae]